MDVSPYPESFIEAAARRALPDYPGRTRKERLAKLIAKMKALRDAAIADGRAVPYDPEREIDIRTALYYRASDLCGLSNKSQHFIPLKQHRRLVASGRLGA